MQGFQQVARRIAHPIKSHSLTSAKSDGTYSVFDVVNGRLPSVSSCAFLSASAEVEESFLDGDPGLSFWPDSGVLM